MDSHLTPIPDEFYAFATGQPFSRCLVCEADLLTGELDYFIEKSVRNYREHEVTDVVYEYAICWHCAHDMNARMSEASLQNMQEYFSRQHLFMQKLAAYNDLWPTLTGSYVPDQCVITGKPRALLDEYMIYGHFRGDKMVKSSMPYLLSSEVMDEVADLLSAKTIDQLDDFMGQYFGGPPELEELWKPRRPVFF